MIELNTDFSTKGFSSQEKQSIVAAWEAGAIRRKIMLDTCSGAAKSCRRRANE